MKNLLTITLLLFALSSSAQTVGVLIQPEFETSVVRKGFFAETKVIDRVGIYADFKFGKETSRGSFYVDEHYFRTEHIQVNAGLSFSVIKSIKAVVSKSVLNQSSLYLRSEKENTKWGTTKNDASYQFGIMYKEGFLSILAAYETGQRATLGVGFNF